MQSVLLLLVGGALVKIASVGTYVRYVKAGQHAMLVAAGVVLVAVAVANLMHAARRGPDTARATAGRVPDGHDHSHSHQGWDPSWLLLAPALALLLVAPPALGSYAAARGGSALSAGAPSDYPPLPAGYPVRVSVLEYAGRAVFDRGRSLGTRRITLSGFIVSGAADRRYLTRMVITCCAADARPIKVGLAGNLPADLTPDTWLEVTGVYTSRTDRDPLGGAPIPYLNVQAARAIAAPAQPYES